MGTAAYMAPEQAVGAPVDRRADIWSFGVVLWQMLTGKPLFRGDAVAHILANVINSPIDFSRLPETTPIPIRDLLQRCLERDVKSRLQWIGEARVAIQKYLVNPRSGVESPAQAISLPHRTSKAAWVAAGVFATASVALGVALRAPWRAAPEPAKPVRFQFTPENVTVASSFRFALSPDGTKLAYQASGGDGAIRLWVRSLDTLEARPLPATDVSANVPFFWSYDSRFVVFGSTGSLKKIGIAGGPPQTLCAVTGVPVGGSWNRDGVILFGKGTTGPVMQVSSEGGTVTPVTTIDPARDELFHQSPVFLPDGRAISDGRPYRVRYFLAGLRLCPRPSNVKNVLEGSAVTRARAAVDRLGRTGDRGEVYRIPTCDRTARSNRSLLACFDFLPVAEWVGPLVNPFQEAICAV
ncbi:MAG: protein kinase [Acidobacteriia bacterium]|nr:protein kinase [Terriglobia bacterium]